MIYSESSIVQIFTLLPAVFCININEYHITANGFTYFQPTTCNYGLRCSKTSVWYLLHFLNVKFRHSVVLRYVQWSALFLVARCIFREEKSSQNILIQDGKMTNDDQGLCGTERIITSEVYLNFTQIIYLWTSNTLDI